MRLERVAESRDTVRFLDVCGCAGDCADRVRAAGRPATRQRIGPPFPPLFAYCANALVGNATDARTTGSAHPARMSARLLTALGSRSGSSGRGSVSDIKPSWLRSSGLERRKNCTPDRHYVTALSCTN